MKLEDGIILLDEKTGEKWIFNYLTLYKIVVACVEKYGNKTKKEAKEIVDKSFIVTDPPKNIDRARYYAHEDEYHWAMILLHGEAYWESIPDSYPPDDEYYQWVIKYVKQNNLEAELMYNSID